VVRLSEQQGSIDLEVIDDGQCCAAGSNGQCQRGQRARADEGDRAGVIRVLLAEDQATTRGALGRCSAWPATSRWRPRPHAGTKYCH
jgi:hypothetical protein